MKTKQSTRRGATIERQVLIRKIRRMQDEYAEAKGRVALEVLEEWIYKRVPRFKKRKGGL